MSDFFEKFGNQVKEETKEYLSQEGIMPVMMPRIDLEITPDTRERLFQNAEDGTYQDALEEVDVGDIDEKEELSFDNTESEWRDQDEEIPRKGSFSQETTKDSAAISVNLTPFDLLPYATASEEETYRNWVEDNLDQETEQVIDRLEGAVSLHPGETAAEIVFHTVQRKADLAQENFSTLPEPVRQVYEQILRNQKDDAVATGVHEGAHARFNEQYDFNLPDLSEAEIDLVIEEVRDQVEGYGFIDETLQNHWEDAIERVAGKEPAQQYREFVRLNGINEVYARIAEKSYEKDDITGLEKDNLYEEGSFWGELNYEGQNPFSEEGGSPGKVSGVKVGKLTEYMAENGLNSVLEMSQDQLVNQFYDRQSEEAL